MHVTRPHPYISDRATQPDLALSTAIRAYDYLPSPICSPHVNPIVPPLTPGPIFLYTLIPHYSSLIFMPHLVSKSMELLSVPGRMLNPGAASREKRCGTGDKVRAIASK